MGLGSIVRLSWDLISMSTATDYLVSPPILLWILLAVLSQACSVGISHRAVGIGHRAVGIGHMPAGHSPHHCTFVPMLLISIFSCSYGQLQPSFSCQPIETVFEGLQNHTRLLCNLLVMLCVKAPTCCALNITALTLLGPCSNLLQYCRQVTNAM